MMPRSKDRISPHPWVETRGSPAARAWKPLLNLNPQNLLLVLGSDGIKSEDGKVVQPWMTAWDPGTCSRAPPPGSPLYVLAALLLAAWEAFCLPY